MKQRQVEEIQVTQYKTSDGMAFADHSSATLHQQVLDISEVFENDPDFYLPRATPQEVVQWFVEHYHILPKEKT